MDNNVSHQFLGVLQIVVTWNNNCFYKNCIFSAATDVYFTAEGLLRLGLVSEEKISCGGKYTFLIETVIVLGNSYL